MKLTSRQIHETLEQFEAEAIPDDHPAVAELNQVYGEHTFFLDDEGLNIVAAGEPTDGGTQAATVIKLASWADAKRTTLAPHEPQSTDLVVELPPEE
jgi:hypothetical protein